ncbi:hypothetical protein NKH77_11045 [Streptomyces sp. M19]
MSAEDVVTAGLRGLELGEVVCAPGSRTRGCWRRCPRPTSPRSAGRAPRSPPATGWAEPGGGGRRRLRRTRRAPVPRAPPGAGLR